MDISSSAAAPLLSCQDSTADASAELSTRTIQDVQSADGDLTVTYTATDEHALTMNRTGTLVDNDASTSVLSLLAVRFDVVRDTVQLSCSTTLSGDPRAPQPQEVEDQVFVLQVSVAATGAMVAELEDTIAPTIVTLPPGTYGIAIENKTAPQAQQPDRGSAASASAPPASATAWPEVRASTVVSGAAGARGSLA